MSDGRTEVLDRPESRPAKTTEREQPVYFDSWDLLAILAFTVVAFVLRFYSPIMPDFFLHPFQGPFISDCVSSTPIDPAGNPGKLCGLSYPFNRGYPDNNGVLSPPHGQVFDEIYFPVDAYNDLKGMQLCRPTMTDDPLASRPEGACPYNYFDPEPPLAKTMIGAGEWAYGWYRAQYQGATGNIVDLGFNTFGWRIAVCIFGTLCVPLMYLLARRLWPNRLFAIAAATLVCFDGMFFLQSRIGMIDIFPIFFILTAYFLFLVHIQSRSFNASMVSLLALGIVLGIGIAAKWIVLAAWLSICFWLVARIVLRRLNFEFGPRGWPFLSWRRDHGPVVSRMMLPTYVAVAAVALVVIPAGIYLVSWYPFFARGQFQSFNDLVAYTQWSFSYHHT
ncbi:MAG TPA: phospholipid carrier-dependent glycosyltransferase, partial [Candidatus Dormibacteraeota bacterium]